MWFTIESDLRFLSHRDTVRAVERAAGRARLPVKYTQGFNPHPVLSLPCPRPVGAASQADLAVLTLTEPLEAEDLLALLNARAPRGMTFVRAEVLEAKASPQPTRVDYDAPIDEAMLATVAERADALNRAETWPVERRSNKPSRRGPAKARELDLKALVRDLNVRDGHLRFSLVSDGKRWARPGEVLEAVGLDGRVDTSRLVRTNLLCDF